MTRAPRAFRTCRIATAALLLTLGTAYGGACAASPSPPGTGTVRSSLGRPDPDAHYLIYLHPKVVEDVGLPAVSPEYGAYQYEEILDRLAGYGFTVVSEVRPREASSTAWAARVASQIDSLLLAGVAPHHVAVVGASKGAFIAALVSHAVERPGVRYVLLAMCPAEIVSSFRERGIDLHGDVLAIRDVADRPDYAGTCGPLFEASPDIGRHEEIVLDVGTGHGILFQPLDEWVEPTVRWVSRAPAMAAPTDTLRLEVGSPEVDALFLPPHRARNTVYIGDATTPVTTWTNELTVGDSAGRRVHRWVTRGTQANGATWELHQTYDGRTLAPLKWAQRSSAGADSRLVIDGRRVRGVLKGPTTEAVQVDRTLERAGFIASATDLVPMAVGHRAGLVMIAPVWSPQGTTVEERVFTVVGEEPVMVEGRRVVAWKVTEHVRATHELKATWWLTAASPYMVLAEIPLANGQTQRITGVALD